LLAAGVYAGSKVVSPATAAANAKPPVPSNVTATLEQRALSSSITARGSVSSGGGYRVLAGATAGPDAVVTSVGIKRGAIVGDGSLVADVSGEPVLAAVLPFPLYRDIPYGASGPDVLQVERMLSRLGYLSEPRNTADAKFQTALRRLLIDHGYPELLRAKPVAEGGVVMARKWFVRIDRAGRHVSQINLKVGSLVDDAKQVVLECDAATPSIATVVDQTGGKQIHVGDAAVIVNADDGNPVEGHVQHIGQPSAAGVRVTISPDDPSQLASATGDLRVTITAHLTNGPVIVSAYTEIYTALDGQARLLVDTGNPQPTTVPVTVGQCGQGWCAISSTEHDLHAGDTVIVGAPSTPGDDG
jgi:HlyD family secretion protein